MFIGRLNGHKERLHLNSQSLFRGREGTDACLAWVQIVAKVYNINPHPHHEIFLFLLGHAIIW